jgi:peroxiredoxin
VSASPRIFWLLLFWIGAGFNFVVGAETNLVLTEHRAVVPHRLLALLHAPEVHEELGLDAANVAKLEEFFGEIDGPWFQARILPPEKQATALDQLEIKTRGWLKEHFNSDQNRRIVQLEWQALAMRMMLRQDVVRLLKITPEQQQEFFTLSQETDKLQTELAALAQSGKQDEAKTKALKAALQKEVDAVKRILSETQLRSLAKGLGETFPTQNLKRIYPMAPEFGGSGSWLNSQPLTMQSLRGKVVLVHFYAFQCHNCIANFDVYRRWHDSLREKGVVVLGIQTPETPSERDPVQIEKAAVERKLTFPIFMDLKSESWKAWGNTMWPTVYVVDKRGYIRHWWQGELRWQGATGDKTIENVVNEALAEQVP